MRRGGKCGEKACSKELGAVETLGDADGEFGGPVIGQMAQT